MVDNVGYLEPEWFEGKKNVGITAGASAPEILVQEVIDMVSSWGHDTVHEVQVTEESIVFALPKLLRKE